jgi:hypothetical protein
MLGNFQQSHLRIELKASENVIGDSLLKTTKLREWLFPVSFSSGLPEKLHEGLIFTTWTGFIPVNHEVKVANDNCLCLLLSQGIDGYHEWCWGDGWVQSRLEGISLLPLSLGQTFNLLKLRQYVTGRDASKI